MPRLSSKSQATLNSTKNQKTENEPAYSRLLQLLHLKGDVADRVRRELPRQEYTDSWGKKYIFRPNAKDFEDLIEAFSGRGSGDDEFGVTGDRASALRQIYSAHGAVTAATARRLVKNPDACFLVTWPDRSFSSLVTYYIFKEEFRGVDALIKVITKDERIARANIKFGRTENDENYDDSADTDDE